MVDRRGSKIKFYGCNMYPECRGKGTLDRTVLGWMESRRQPRFLYMSLTKTVRNWFPIRIFYSIIHTRMVFFKRTRF